MKYSIIALLMLLLPFAACKKEKTTHDKLVGTWVDGNDNYITLNGDGSGELRVMSYGAAPFTWTLDGDKKMYITYKGGGTETWTILLLNDTQLYVEQGNSGPIYCHRR